jgi:DNA-binding NarL/FixJ family response regulator
MNSARIRVFIVDDHPFVREWLANLLGLEPDFVVAGQSDDPVSALAAMTANPPDIAVVDLTLKKGSGLELVKGLRAQAPAVGIVILSMHDEVTDVERAFRAGATAYVMKHESTSQIVQAIREARAGRIFANPAMLAHLTARLMNRSSEREGAAPGEVLSDRELEVFRRMGRGQSTRDIAEQLGVSLKTVQTYCARIKEKLGLQNAQELARAAFRWHEREDAGKSVNPV